MDFATCYKVESPTPREASLDSRQLPSFKRQVVSLYLTQSATTSPTVYNGFLKALALHTGLIYGLVARSIVGLEAVEWTMDL